MQNNHIDSGRIKLDETEKAKAVPLRLYDHEIELLDACPGKNRAEKARWLLETMVPMQITFKRQVRKLEGMISRCYELRHSTVDPDLTDSGRCSKRSEFIKQYGNLSSLIDFLEIDRSLLIQFLSRKRLHELDIIITFKTGLDS